MKRKKHIVKRIISLVLVLLMLGQTMMPVVEVRAEELSVEQQFAAQLLDYSEQYPEGAFVFEEAQINMSEGGEYEIVILRKGNRDQEATVSLRVIDVSAKNGEDYMLYENRFLIDSVIEGDEETKTLVETLNEMTEETEATEETEMMDSEETEAVETEENTTDEKKSSLQAAKDAFLGEDSDRVDWKEVDRTDEAYQQMEELEVQEELGLEQFAAGMDGIQYDLKFKAGEYKKTIKVKAKKDTITESEEQILCLLYNAQNAELGDVATAYINISDTNQAEKAVFEMVKTDIYVERGKEYVDIPIKRTEGEFLHASVIVGTKEDTAKVSTDYVSTQEELFFMQGSTEQTIRIPLNGESMTAGEVGFYVGLQGKGSEVDPIKNATYVHIVEKGQVAKYYAKAANNQSTSTVNIETSFSLSSNGKNEEVSETLEGSFELSTADYIEVDYELTTNGRTWTSGSGCDEKTYSSSKVSMTITVGDKSVTVNSNGNKSGKETIEIDGSETAQVSNAKMTVSVKPTNDNNNAKVKIKNIKIHYPGYVFKINNATDDSTSEDSYAVYNEVQYYPEGGTTVSQKGPKIVLGKMQFEQSSEKERLMLYQPSDIIVNTYLNTNVKSNHNSQDVTVSSENTEFVGFVIKKGKKETDIIPISELKFNKAFIEKYKDYISTSAEGNKMFDIYPVFKPKTVSVYFALTEGDDYYYKNIPAGKILSCTMLDTIRVQAVSNDPGKTIEDVVATTIEKNGSASAYPEDVAKELECDLVNEENVEAIRKESFKFLWWTLFEKTIVYKLGTIQTDLVKADNNNDTVFWITPQKNLFVFAQTYVYTVRVEADYTNGENFEIVEIFKTDEDENLVLDEDGNPIIIDSYKGIITYVDATHDLFSDPETPMVITGIQKGNTIKLLSITVKTTDGTEYKTNWNEFTGDLDENGSVDTSELDNLGDYKLMTSNVASVLQFTVNKKDIILRYGFKEVDQNVRGILQGNVYIVQEEIFTGKKITAPLKGATVIADDQNAITGENKDKGAGQLKTDGYYYMKRTGWTSSDYLYLSIYYNGLTYNCVQNPNVAKKIEIPANKPISVQKGSAKIYNENNTILKVDDVTNGNHVYTLELTAQSSDSGVIPKEAELSFYDKAGLKKHSIKVGQVQIEQEGANGEVETLTDTGMFRFTFNPKELQLTAGTTLKIKFTDQLGNTYYEQPTGIVLAEALGLVSFLNSTSMTAATGSILGTIDSVFDFGWSGEFDEGDCITNQKLTIDSYEARNEYGQMVTVTKEQKIKTISFGFDFDKDRVIANDYKKGISGIAADAANMAEAEEDLIKEKEKLAKLEADASASEKDIKKQKAEVAEQEKELDKAKKTYDNTVKENNEKRKSSVNLAVNASVDVAFALNITMLYDESKEQWYFRDMLLSVDYAGGVSTKFLIATPIGLDIVMTIVVGMDDSSSLMTVMQRDGGDRYYLQKEGDKGGAKIDIFDCDMDNADRMFDYRGENHIAPKLTLTGEIGNDLTSTTVGADVTALFDLYYYTDPTKEDIQKLKINGGIFVQVLTFKKRWDLGTAEINLSGNSSKSKEMVKALKLSSTLYDSVDTLVIDDRGYLANRSEWNATEISEDVRSSFQEQVLMSGTYGYPDVQFQNMEDGSVLAVYVDAVPSRDAINNTAVYYTIYNKNGSKIWEEPKIIDDDGTLDDAPTIADLGEKGIMVAWSSADRVFDENADVIDVLRSRNIKTALFDKESKEFAKVQQATYTTDEDITGDVEPSITYFEYEGEERMLMIYSKNEYERSALEEGVIGDAVNPYSVMAYLYYDFENGEWRHTYSEEEKQAILSGLLITEEEFAEYEASWYGQGFLRLSPNVTIQETLDESGYWVTEPVITEGAVMTPIVVDSTMITYNGLGIFAYVADQDANLQTDADRDIYMQIYDYIEDEFTHPIMITGDSKVDSNIKFVRNGGDTYLSWISDDEIKVLNISAAVRNGAYVEDVLSSGESYYYFDKTEGSGYVPPYTVTSYAMEMTALGESSAAGKTISDFDAKANGDYIYVLWTESENVLKDGIVSGSEEAKNPENFITEQQIYGSRFDITTGCWSGRVQLSETEGAYYGDLDFSIREDGSILIMAQKAESKEVESDGYKFTTKDEDSSSLVQILVRPEAEVKLETITLENPSEGTETEGVVEIRNEGFADISDVTLVVTDEAGNELLSKSIESIDCGESLKASFDYQLPTTDAEEYEWNITAKLIKDSAVLDQKDLSGTVAAQTAITKFEVMQSVSRYQAEIMLDVANLSNKTSPEDIIEVVNEKTGQVLTSLQIPSLAKGETSTVTAVVAVTDEMFVREVADDGDVTEKMTLSVKDTYSEYTRELTRKTSADVIALFDSITDIEIYEGLKLEAKEQEFVHVSLDVKSPMMQLDERTTYENYGIRVIWEVADEEIATVSTNGTVKGIKPGKTILRAYILPASNLITFNDEGRAIEQMDSISPVSDVYLLAETEITITGADIEDGDSEDGGIEPPLTGDQTDVTYYMYLLVLGFAFVAIAFVQKRKETK